MRKLGEGQKKPFWLCLRRACQAVEIIENLLTCQKNLRDTKNLERIALYGPQQGRVLVVFRLDFMSHSAENDCLTAAEDTESGARMLCRILIAKKHPIGKTRRPFSKT